MDNRIDSPSTVMTLQVGTTEQTRMVQEALPGRTVRTDHAWLAPRQPIPAHNRGANPTIGASHERLPPDAVRQTFEDLMKGRRAGKLVEAKELGQLLVQIRVLATRPEGVLSSFERSSLLSAENVDGLQKWKMALDKFARNPETEALVNREGAIKHVVEDIRQERTNACGESCVQALLAFHELDHDKFGTSDRAFHIGSSPDMLRDQLEALGIGTMYLEPAQPGQVSTQELRQGLAYYGPLLAWGRTHAVIIAGLDGDNVTIHCPLLGAREMSLRQLNNYLRWSGASPPIAATYKTEQLMTQAEQHTARAEELTTQEEQRTTEFQPRPRPGRLAHFAVRVEVAAFAVKYHDWKPVKRNGQS